MGAAGHGRELHCYAHIGHMDHADEAELEADTVRALRVLRGVGAAPKRWRPPYGEWGDRTGVVAARHGLEVTFWSIDPEDYRDRTVDGLLAVIVPALVPGAVVLLHDGMRTAHPRGSAANTAGLIAPLVEAIRARGLEPAVLPA